MTRKVPLSTKVYSPVEWQRRSRKKRKLKAARRKRRKWDQSNSWNCPDFVETFRCMP